MSFSFLYWVRRLSMNFASHRFTSSRRFFLNVSRSASERIAITASLSSNCIRLPCFLPTKKAQLHGSAPLIDILVYSGTRRPPPKRSGYLIYSVALSLSCRNLDKQKVSEVSVFKGYSRDACKNRS